MNYFSFPRVSLLLFTISTNGVAASNSDQVEAAASHATSLDASAARTRPKGIKRGRQESSDNEAPSTPSTSCGESPSADTPPSIKNWNERLRSLASPISAGADSEDELEGGDLEDTPTLVRYRQRYLAPTPHSDDETDRKALSLGSLANPYAKFLVAVYRLTCSFSHTTPSFDRWWPSEVPDSEINHPLNVLKELAATEGMPEAWQMLAGIYATIGKEEKNERSDFWWDDHKDTWLQCQGAMIKKIKKQAEEGKEVKERAEKEELWIQYYVARYFNSCPIREE